MVEARIPRLLVVWSVKSRTQYIVTENQILSTIESALEDHITNPTIIRELMKSIENNVETVLEDDCEVYKE